MLNSLVRVSRRVGWVNDALAASLQPATCKAPPAVLFAHGSTLESATHGLDADATPSSHVLKGGDGEAQKCLATPRTGDDRLTSQLITGEGYDTFHRPPTITPPSGRRA